MMASIRLFGRGKSAAGADGGTAVSAAQIAELLAGLRTASMSTTWRCRHGSGTAIGEGAVDFETRRSRSTVIRGKSAFEYVRVGSSVYRAPVEDDEVRAQLGGGKSAAAATRGSAANGAARVISAAVDDEDDDEAFDDDAEIEAEAELDADEEFDESDESDDDADIELDAESDAEATESDEVTEDEADVDGVDPSEDAIAADEHSLDADEKDGDAPALAWQTFSEHDACGVHAYAEPAVLAAGVRAAGAVTAAGRQEFDGRMLSGYAVTLKPKPGDPDRVLARLARQLRDHGANTLVVTAFVDQAAGAAEAVPDFSGADDADASAGEGGTRIVRLRLELAHWTPADDPTADHAVTVDLFEFGDPVEVQVPGGRTSRRTVRSCADLALF